MRHAEHKELQGHFSRLCCVRRDYETGELFVALERHWKQLVPADHWRRVISWQQKPERPLWIFDDLLLPLFGFFTMQIFSNGTRENDLYILVVAASSHTRPVFSQKQTWLKKKKEREKPMGDFRTCSGCVFGWDNAIFRRQCVSSNNGVPFLFVGKKPRLG